MKTIKITEEKRNKIISEISSTITKYQDDNGLEAVLTICYIEKKKGPTIRVTLVVANDEYKRFISDEAQSNKIDDEFYQENGFGIQTVVEPLSNFRIIYNHSENDKTDEIFNSTVVFDRTGKLSRIKQSIADRKNKRGEGSKYDNIVKFDPPVKSFLRRRYQEGKKRI